MTILAKPAVMPTGQGKEPVIESFAAKGKGIHIVTFYAVC